MIYMGSDNRVLWHNLLLQQEEEISQKAHGDNMNMKTIENRKSQSDDKTKSGETNKVRKNKYEAEIAAITQKQEVTESLKIPKQAEGVVDPGVTALPHWNEDTTLQLQWRRDRVDVLRNPNTKKWDLW